MSTGSSSGSTDIGSGYFDEEFMAAIELSHRTDDREMERGKYRPLNLRAMATRRAKEGGGFDNIPSGHVRVIVTERFAMRHERSLVELDVPRSMTIKTLRKELYVSALSRSTGRSAFMSFRPNIGGRQSSPEELQESFCDYEFSLTRFDENLGRRSEVLPDASSCGDLVSPGDPPVLCVHLRFMSYSHSGSIRTTVPGNFERQEKHAFLTVMQNLPSADFSLVVLAVGTNSPEQVLPNFAIDAAMLGYRVCVVAVNPGFYHGICPCMGDLEGRGSMKNTLFLAYNRHPPGHSCSTIYDRARAWESWEKVDRGNFAGSFVLTADASTVLSGGYMEMHTFAMSWPGRPANRELDHAILDAVSQALPFLSTTTCHFVAFFTTWSDESDFNVAHLSQWRAVVPFFNSFHAIIDSHGQDKSGRFCVFQNIDLAISGTAHMHDDKMLKALGGRRINKLADVSLDEFGFFELQ